MRLLVEILFLSLLYGAVVLLHQLVALPFPPVLSGMLLMLLLLRTGILQPQRWELASRFFSRHMMLFLIPLLVGIMNYWRELSAGGWRLLVIIVASTASVLIGTAWAAIWLKREGSGDDER